MWFGFFSKYRAQQYHTTQADGTYTFTQMWLAQRGWGAYNPNSQFTMEMRDENLSTYPATTFVRYGFLANNSNVATTVAQRKDGRALLQTGTAPIGGWTSATFPYMYSRMNQWNYPAMQWQSGWAGSSRPFYLNNIFHRPELVRHITFYYQSGAAGDGDNWNSAINGTQVTIPYFINLEALIFDFGVRGMKADQIIGTRFPSNMKSIWISGGSQPSVIAPKFPASLEYLVLSVTNTTLRNDLSRLISDCVNMKALMLTTEAWGDASPAAMPVSGVLNISHMQNLIALSLSSTALTDISWSLVSNNQFERLKLRSCTSLSTTTFLNLINLVTRSTSGLTLDTAGSTRQYVKTYKHADTTLSFTSLVSFNNYHVGDYDYPVVRTPITYFRIGAYTQVSLIDGTGINATANSATAGTATIQLGGAGGAGGSNASGSSAQSTSTAYGGGGGGAGYASGATSLNGGSGRQGLIRVSYYTGGVELTDLFTSSGTFNVPADTSEILVECWGAGGGGGGRGTTIGASGGGGGGAYARRRISVTPSSSVSYTVGLGGSGGTGLSDGQNGGDTFWGAGTQVKAAGGKGGLATLTGGNGGAIIDSIGDLIYAGGNGSTKTTNTSPGGGGGGGAGSNGTKNNNHYVDISGLTQAVFIDMSDCQIGNLNLPANTVVQDLGLAGNRLDYTVNPSLQSQIQAMSNLRRCWLSPIAMDYWGPLRGQNSTNGLGSNWNFSSMTQLIGLGLNSCKLTGTLTLPNTSTLSRVTFLDNNVTGITGTNAFTGMIVLLPGNNPNFNFDFTRVPAIYSLIVYDGGNGYNTAITLLDLTARTSTNAMGTNISTNDVNGGLGYYFQASHCTNLTEIRFPTTSARCTFLTVNSSWVCNFSFNPNLTTLVNLDNLTYSADNGQQRYFIFNDCSLNIDFRLGINNILPTQAYLQNNSMSQANVELNIDRVYVNRDKWNAKGSFGKVLNIGGTNGSPSGTFQAPTGFKRAVISAITRANPCVVTMGTTIGTFANDDVIFIRQATGITQLNNTFFTIKNLSGTSFELWNASGTAAIDSSAYPTAYNANTGIMFIDGTPSSPREQMYVLTNNYQWTITVS